MTHRLERLVFVAAATLVALVVAIPATAQPAPIMLAAIDNGPTEPGTRVPLGTFPTGGAGADCTVVFEAVNNSSVWDGNAIEVATGGQIVTLAGVEDEPGITVTAGPVPVGDEATFTLVVGPTGRYSIEGIVELVCTVPASTTTSPVTTTSTPPSSISIPPAPSLPPAPPATPVITVPDLTG